MTNMGCVNTYLFKCKCGYETELNEGSYLCSDENGETFHMFTAICHCKKCGNIEEILLGEEKHKCKLCGSNIKGVIPIFSVLFPKLLHYLPPLKCPKCGKKHLKLSKDDCEIERINVCIEKVLLLVLILSLLITIYIFRDFILAKLMAYTLTH